ncbi:MAG: sulfotransferase domain-containing protein [Myxococcales bacterium]|nr:sulfotransferase domain-containing protein [Myxococcales bacterium]
MVKGLREGLLSPQSVMALVAQAGARLGFTDRILQLLVGKIVPKEHEALLRYEPTAHDVFVATFAKSGTNWAMQMCQQIASRGTAEFEHIHQLVAWPEAPYAVVPLDDPGPQRSSPTGLRVIKTHLWAFAVPYDPAAKYVTIIRDPKEVVVSAYYFLLGLLGIRDRVSPAEWIELSLQDDRFPRQWAEHSMSYWLWRSKPNVLVRTFADLKADHAGTVDALAALMGVALSEAERAAVIERSTFSTMKSIDERFAPPRTPLVRADQHPNMMRRGASGRADELMGADARARLDEACRRQLRRLGSELPYDELFGGR